MNHVHDILNLLKRNPAGFKVEDLVSELNHRFGKDARYTTCGNHSLDHQEAINFVIDRQKALYRDGKIYINAAIESC